MKHFTYQIETKRKPPQRLSQPHSKWREVLNTMKVGHWFLVPEAKRFSAATAGTKYCKGRYSLYRHPTNPKVYVFLRTR